ncbi:aldehyde dehydrogenase family protein [Streptomyces sp. NPDC002851]
MNLRYDTFYIDGTWQRTTTGQVITSVNASTEEPLGQVTEGAPADIDAAVTAARRAFGDPVGRASWAPQRRAEAMERLADAIDKRAGGFVLRVSSQSGMPVAVGQQLEADFPTMVLRYYAGLAREAASEEAQSALSGASVEVRKVPAIALDDAELDLAKIGADLFTATLLNNGQTCFTSTRILAPHSRYAEVVDAFTTLAASLTIGDALDPDTGIGPLATARQRDRAESYIAKGRGEGERITTGGGRPAGLGRGWFVQPTVFAEVDNSSVIAHEEIFGPVLSITAYNDIDGAVRIATDSEFGLGGTVWTGDPERGCRRGPPGQHRHNRRQPLQPRARRPLRRRQGQRAWAASWAPRD